MNTYGLNRKLITTRNPQANAMVERVHQTVHNMIHTTGLTDQTVISDGYGFKGILAAVRRAVNSTVHTTLQALPTQLYSYVMRYLTPHSRRTDNT